MKVLGMASGLAMTIAFALVARRLLGLRFGLVRMLLAGALALAVMGPVSSSLLQSTATGRSVTPLRFLILALAALLVAMVFLVVAEALVPSGSLPGPLEWRRRIARTRRYAEITRIALRHGLLPYLRGRGRARLDAPQGRPGRVGAGRRGVPRRSPPRQHPGAPGRTARPAGLRLGRQAGRVGARGAAAPAAGHGPRRPAGRQRQPARSPDATWSSRSTPRPRARRSWRR